MDKYIDKLFSAWCDEVGCVESPERAEFFKKHDLDYDTEWDLLVAFGGESRIAFEAGFKTAVQLMTAALSK